MANRVRASLTPPDEARAELMREGTMMVLYVSVVEIAELAALPESRLGHGLVAGAVGGHLLAIVWGTAVGLAIAHWFAFRLAGRLFRHERPTELDTKVGFVQLGAAMAVAAVTSLPTLLFSETLAQETTGDVPALLLGVVGYVVAREAGTSRPTAVGYGFAVIAAGVVVALVKSGLSAHL